MTTRDDVIRMAREAGLNDYSIMGSNLEIMERFAALVAKQEREACARMCDTEAKAVFDGCCSHTADAVEYCANAIRARTNSTVKQSLTVAEAVAAEREACLAEIETGIWIDMTTDEIIASIADAIRARGAK